MSAPARPSEPTRSSASTEPPAPTGSTGSIAPDAPAVPHPTTRVHEPRRADCPWCGSARLHTRLRSGDLRRFKPGTFTVDACQDCGHTFQNPRLTAEGLALYLRTVRGEPGDPATERLLTLRGSPRRRRSAARAMLPFGEPESWLDVGTGHGRFPATAQQVFPYTSFDGLDATPRVEHARAAGRVEEAHVGHLTDPRITARLRARYDVVSMFHHLERTQDPRAELAAALDVLRPGGHLLVEGLDPGSLLAGLLGRWWLPYDQPRHLHLMPARNLSAELQARGCAIVTVDHHSPHVPHDLAGATALALSHALPAPDTPWRAIPPTLLQQRLRTVLSRAGSVLVAAAAVTDHALAPLLRHTRCANTYRIIARKPPQ
ncbi:class I SAM-dependent methyltransferase [Streptomyces bullii]|uniref:Class I SAM-dependent methyltransferase n=1 Tax=Streptomyces bullii TaxID=349910 RepID=A0ABW0UU22_9ACTN